ncbi:MAG: deoxyguanosinetriphosphate triphosphohydrolase [Ruminococcaceae bacterium]|nr:deoxyguanosinetriphosphate triphosphohydrolase [Oscillospiraceae bacterium]
MTIRDNRQSVERNIICDKGVLSENSKGRVKKEHECSVRTCFQRDVDRIIYSKAFRRLKHKTQVFLQPEGDHYRTRLTHTLEVSRIARTIARALMLNEDLTEAVALGHDLGHTPFGHAGERALDKLIENNGGFRHYEQSLRVVDRIEKDGEGLNLTHEVRDGIVRHTTDPLCGTLEGQIVRISDRIAYINHDVDDAIRAGILRDEDIPTDVREALGDRYSMRIDTLVKDVINNSAERGLDIIAFSPEMGVIADKFHKFMFASVYKNPKAKSEEAKVLGILEGIFTHFMKNPDKLSEDYKAIADADGLRRAVCDYVSGMTDKYAISIYKELYIPASWHVI